VANSIVNACNGGADCKVHVTGTGVGTVQTQVSALSPWIRVTSVLNLPGDLVVSIDTSTLSTGSTTGSFIVYSSANSQIQQTITVNATVTSSSQLSATPPLLTFNAQVGASSGTPQSGTCPIQNSPASCQITVQTTSAQPITYNITTSTTDGKQWLQPDAASGKTNGSPFNLAVNPQAVGNNPGTYHGQVIITSTTNQNDTVTIAVTMNVNSTPAVTVTPVNLTYYYTIGGPVPTPQTATVSATGGATSFSVSQSAGSSWLGVSPISGSVSPTASVPLSVSVSPTNPTVLGVGKYTATITINPNSGGAAQQINVTLFVSVNPFLTAPTTTLSFNAPFGGSAPVAQTIVVGSTGGALSFTASASSDSNWLTVTPGTGTTGQPSGTISASVNQSVLSTLGVGTYNGTIVITPTNGDQYNIQITATLTVGAASQITAAPQAMFFSYQIGQSAPAAQTLTLMASGPPVSFSVSTSLTASNPTSCGTAAWLAATAQNSPSTTPNALTVTINPTGMTAGICTGKVTVTYASSTGNVNLDVPVTLFVDTKPLLNISLPQGFGVETTTLGGSNIGRQISMTSTDGTTAINYTVTFNSTSCVWLFAAPLSGTTPTPLQLSIQPACIATPGSYPGSVTITSPNLPQQVILPISLVVTSNVQVAVTPQALSFVQTLNGALPDPQKLNFTVSGGQANFVATVSTDLPGNSSGSWLKVDPASGNTSAGSVTVSVLPNNLPVSTTPYNGRITLTFQNAATPAVVIPVRYTVNPPQTATVTPTSLTFAYQLNGAAPAAQQINVSSTGGAVNFTAAVNSNGGWLGIDTTSSSTPANGNPKAINVTVDPTKIPAGTQAGASLQGTVVITAPSALAAPVTVNVTLNISAAAVPAPQIVLNSASLSAASVAPGELIAIKGTNLGPATSQTFTVNSNNTVSSTLGGVQVTFNGVAGIPTFVSSTQINVIVPWELAAFSGTVQMVISYNGGQSTPITLNLTPVSPAIYTQNATGQGAAAAVNLSPNVASPYNGAAGTTYPGTTQPVAPAPQGSFVAFFLAGCGVTIPNSTTGTVNSATQILYLKGWTDENTQTVVTATIGGKPAHVQFAGAAPTLISGVCQVNLQVPTGLTPGNNIPVSITINGTQTLGAATMSVQ
jgi:uncharacterized protein (TIGR03437 family)